MIRKFAVIMAAIIGITGAGTFFSPEASYAAAVPPEIIAEAVGAQPIITTATDAGGRFSPDCFAAARFSSPN